MLLKDARFLVIDTETTGFDHKNDRVVQIGAVLLDSDFHPAKTYETLVSPGDVSIPAEASAIHHIVDEDVIGAPSLKEALSKVDTLGNYNAIAAHNAPFDMGFINPPSHFPVLDTLRLARKLWPDLNSHKNQFLRYYFKLKVGAAEGQMAHSALPDALVTAAILKHELTTVVQKAKDPENVSLMDLIDWLKRPIYMGASRARFGKHAGKTWEEIAHADRGYLEWMLGPKGMKDLDADLAYTVNRILGRVA